MRPMLGRKRARVAGEINASCCTTCGTSMIYVRTMWRPELKTDIWFCATCRKAAYTPSRETKH